MPTFDTPEPVSIEIDLVIGDVRITAGERQTTAVEVRPSDPSLDLDVRAAGQTRVERTAAGVLVKAPRQRGLGLFGKPGSVDVTVDLPAGSHVRGDAAMAGFRSTGRLGECRIKLSAGSIGLDETGLADLHTGAGAIEVDRVGGPAEVSTGTGRIRLGEVDGPAVVKNSNGDNWIGEVAGDLRTSTANGQISVGHAAADVDASTANGDIRVGEVTRGTAALKTGLGAIEIGISPGTAARLDVYTHFGRVHNQLTEADGPGTDDQVVEVRARTSYGDIVIRRP
ncbi:MAG: hypothetical protein ABJB47_06005 [Actinomycetota bacterium]